MKLNGNKNKLTLEKINITKLNNMGAINGGFPTAISVPPASIYCMSNKDHCTDSTATNPVGSFI